MTVLSPLDCDVQTDYAPLLALKQVSKKFGGVQALSEIDFELRIGEVHGLIGENGAGKSTLMRILAGVVTADSGSILLRGTPVHLASTRDSRACGISMIHQELSSIGSLSAAENLFLDDLPTSRLGLVDWREMRRRSKEWLSELSLDIDVSTLVEDLPVGQQQLIEIARVTHAGSDILIMDEPTSALSPTESERLFTLIRQLKMQDRSIIFISHSIEEIMKICDRITVLRDGRKVATFDNRSLSRKPKKHDLVRAMLGDKASDLETGYEREQGVASVKAGDALLTVSGAGQRAYLTDISFTVHAGEVLGVYGAVGSQHDRIGKCLYGLERFDRGSVTMGGRPLGLRSTYQARRRGIAYVSPDRRSSLFLDAEVYKNITISFLRELIPFPIQKKREVAIAEQAATRLDIRPRDTRHILGHLSGGNQQKVALARWLTHEVKLLILDEPTRGIDVGAKEEVIRVIKELREQGLAILLISCEPETILSVSNRILVISKGRISREFRDERVTKDDLLRHA